MKKTLLIAGALLALTASMATAGGVNLSWADCGAFGTAGNVQACVTVSGAPYSMVGSAIAPAPMGQFNGTTSVLDLQTNTAALNPWWLMQTGGCRAGAFVGNFDFTSGPFSCFDVWAGGASGGVIYLNGFGGANRARMKLTCAIPGNTAITDLDELYIFKANFTRVKSTGTGSCAGCLDGACIVLNEILMTQPLGVGDYKVQNPITRQHVSWQASGVAGCPGATPTKNATWGSVKSLYR